ncbi:hypothetical protein BCR34DRAFT_229086 [Clohesyomyces aquaticus]|uniref:Uncharacterized protein n=1 Tax=Clohesyomyces aquaticus TaxID=1231657 RepID=A0A1Y1ZWH5_9PLEO|nr:hypothetical protein BCR34DRAFT_229086 [Clohesyomyces aquaticus]
MVIYPGDQVARLSLSLSHRGVSFKFNYICNHYSKTDHFNFPCPFPANPASQKHGFTLIKDSRAIAKGIHFRPRLRDPGIFVPCRGEEGYALNRVIYTATHKPTPSGVTRDIDAATLRPPTEHPSQQSRVRNHPPVRDGFLYSLVMHHSRTLDLPSPIHSPQRMIHCEKGVVSVSVWSFRRVS